MSGQPKKSLDFAYWDVRMFDDDERIDQLIDAQGWNGFSIYFYICTKAYATDGYYYIWKKETSPATIARKMGGGIKSETVNEVINLCLRIGLFDNRLFDRESVITSKKMQTIYMNAISKRSPSGRIVNKKYWLLNSEESKAYIIVSENEHSLPENEHSLPENTTKESKSKSKSKIKESSNTTLVPPAAKAADSTNGIFISLILNNGTFYDVSNKDIEHYKELYPSVNIEQELRFMCGWLESNPTRRKTPVGIKSFITRWLAKVQNIGGVRNDTNATNNPQVCITGQSTRDVFTGETIL